MGEKQRDIKKRRARVISEISIASFAGQTKSGSMPSEPLIRPIEDIEVAGSASYISELAVGIMLFIEIDEDERLAVYHGGFRLGWLGGETDLIRGHILSGAHMQCALNSKEVTSSGQTATVAIWL